MKDWKAEYDKLRGVVEQQKKQIDNMESREQRRFEESQERMESIRKEFRTLLLDVIRG